MGNSTHLLCLSAAVASLMGTSGALAFTPPPTFAHVAYSDEHFRHRLDIYIPPDVCGPIPSVIFVYGGGWVVGDKEDVEPYVDPLLERGLAVVAINYRYSYQAIFPAQIHDCKGAIRFLRANAEEFGLDPDHIAIFGESAGAQLAALVATSSGVADLEGTVGGNEKEPSDVQAAGPIAGLYDLVTMIQEPPHSTSSAQLFGYANWWDVDFDDPVVLALVQSADPATQADASDPPFMIVHGEDDVLVPVAQATGLQASLEKASVTSTLTVLPGVGHGVPDADYLPVFDMFAQILIQPPVLGDVTCDGHVNIDDILLVIGAWGLCEPKAPCPADVVRNGVVDIDDLLFVIGNWTG